MLNTIPLPPQKKKVDNTTSLLCNLDSWLTIPQLFMGFYHFYHYDQRESQICHFTDRNLNLAIVHLKHSSVLHSVMSTVSL
jgi:hypothetical protein